MEQIITPSGVKTADAQAKAEDILRLSKGKRSKKRVGSRRVPHRLREYERARFETALARGFLEIGGLRSAILNSFTEYKHAFGKTAVIHEKTPTGDWIHWNPPGIGKEAPAHDSLPQALQEFAFQVTAQGYRCGPMDREVARKVRELLKSFVSL